MKLQAWRLAELAALPGAAVLAVLHEHARARGDAISVREPRLKVSVATDERGAMIRVAGAGLAERLHGSPGRPPTNLVQIEEAGAGIAGAVGAEMAALSDYW